MIEISVKTVEKDKNGAHLECASAIKGNDGDIRREMVGVLQIFDELAGGKILCDAFVEFMEIKIKEEGEEDDN